MRNLKSVFGTRHVASSGSFDLNELVDSLEQKRDAVGGPISVDRSVSVAFESFDSLPQEQILACQEAYENLAEHLQSLGFESFNANRGADAMRLQENQIAAATLANFGAIDEVRYKKALRSMTNAPQSNDPNVHVVNHELSGPYGSIPVLTDGKGLENYNEKSQRDFRVISVAYNLAAARQDAFGEALYPTVVVNPTEGGVTQNLTYAAVLKDVFHQTTGAIFDTKEVNAVEAFRDPTILEDSSTKLIPVVNDDDSNADVFVDPADVPPTTVELEFGSVTTAPLRIGKRFDLIGVSNRHQLLAGQLLDISDTIDPAMRLKAIYVKTANTAEPGEPSNAKVLRFHTERLPTAVFQPALIDDTRYANLNFNTDNLLIDANTRAIDGSTGDALDQIINAGWEVRLGVAVTGSVSTSKGTTAINATPVSVESIRDADGQILDRTAGAAAALIAALGEMEVIGYELDSRFTNTNRRERGQLVQTRTVQFRHPIPMGSPITLPMSTMDESGPGDVVKTLTVLTNIRNSNNAVTRLLNYLAQLREVIGTDGRARPKYGEVEGALGMMIRPTYRYAQLNLVDAIDSIRSKDRWDDVCSVILDRIKSLLFPAYRDSNIEAAFQTITGNADERPKFIIATDKEIAHYLMRQGDDRTLGAYLKYDIVSTNSERFDGKIVVVPTRENPKENDILNFGQFYYVPTIVADLPISRHGQISREIAAIPFNLHVNNIPFAIEIDVTGLKEVMGEQVYLDKVSG